MSVETLKYSLVECCNMRVFFPHTHTYVGVRNHFTQANEPIPDLCCDKEAQIPFYQNNNYSTGRKL